MTLPRITLFHSLVFTLSAISAISAVSLRAADPFEDIIRKTEALSPDQEKKAFHLPPGFEIQLVASDPDIAKPMNMAFDAQGRLWVAESREYPFPAQKNAKNRDTIKVLSNFSANGKAQSIRVFAEGLNIPIGLHPYGNGVIAYSIPNISYFQDTDGDGKADKVQKLYGPFGFDRDTHGMTSAFRRGFDGWLYACHGFNNNTTLTGSDGSSITMNSGNTYRMRVDGSHVEYNTHGQVNPFGLAWDDWGNLYSADCHSHPIYQLLHEGYYPSFGKPHDGLGYAPEMMTHSHGSTAIGGIVVYEDDQFPVEYRNNFFVGNVMTCKINRDTMVESGSTWRAKEAPDFLSSDDPWFRPCDIQLGPDGALYIADFYNRIIGHYEVPLDHPGRDRERGRIWRVVYTGASRTNSFENFTTLGSKDLVKRMDDPSLTRRLLAMNQIIDRIGKSAVTDMRSAMKGSKNPTQQIHLLWALKRLDGMTPALWTTATTSPNANLRNHAMRALAETPEWTPALHKSVAFAVKDAHAEVRRSAAQALASHPGDENLRPLLDLRHSIDPADTHLLYVTRISLRDQLSIPKSYEGLTKVVLNEQDKKALADVSLGVQTEESGKFLVNHILTVNEPRERVVEYLRHAARFAPESELDRLAAFAQKLFGSDLELQLTLLTSVREGLAQRGAKPGLAVIGWASAEAKALLNSATNGARGWMNSPIEGKKDHTSPWFTQSRASADGDKTSLFLSSLPPGGEALTGVLRSPSFALPESVTFYMAGHDGQPPGKLGNKNYVRLVRDETAEVVAQSVPPRNDTAQLVTWAVPSTRRGAMCHLEIVDQDDGSAYAWLAVGRFSEGLPPLPLLGPSQVTRWMKSAAEICESFHITSLNQDFTRILVDKQADAEVRIAAAKTLSSLDSEMLQAIAVPLLKNNNSPAELRDRLLENLAASKDRKTLQTVMEMSKTAPHRTQVRLAQILAASQPGSEELMTAVSQGHASAQLLLDRQVKDRISNLQLEPLTNQWSNLTKGLAALDAERQKIIDQRLVAFKSSNPNSAMGAAVFAKNCAVCHQLAGQGAVVGPQLDGVGNRGAERLCEDILDPNRNVDAAFFYSNVTLKDDQSFSGLFRGEKGQTLLFVDGTGKEITVARQNIKERIESHNSLMPDNFYEVITVQDFSNLLAYLLSQGKK